MANIVKRGDYQWRAKIRRTGHPEQSKTFNTKEEAETWARDVESKMDRGVFVDKKALEKTRLYDLLVRYAVEITPTKKGISAELNKIEVLKRQPISQLVLINIEPGDFVDFRNARIKEVSAATVIKEMGLLSNVLNTARTEWKMRGLENHAKGVRRPKKPGARKRRLHCQDEADRIIAASESTVLKALIPLAIETAMRRGEMTSIRRKHLDLENRTLELFDTKNGEDRVVPLSSAAIALIRNLPLTAAENGELFGVRPHSMSTAFRRALRRARVAYERECEASGKDVDPKFLVGLRLHDLRREATSRLIESGSFERDEVKSITGHKSDSMLDVYKQLRARELAKKLP